MLRCNPRKSEPPSALFIRHAGCCRGSFQLDKGGARSISSVANLATLNHGLRTSPKEFAKMSGNPQPAGNMGVIQAYHSLPAMISATPYSTISDTAPMAQQYIPAPFLHDNLRSTIRSVSPVSPRDNGLQGQREARALTESTSIAPYLQLPSTIFGDLGSLAEFTARVYRVVKPEPGQLLMSNR